MLVADRVQVRPDVEIEVERFTVPAKPFKDAIVIVEVMGVPAKAVALVGLVEMEKSCTVKGMRRNVAVEPLAAVELRV
jgi:hypothetical protein